MSCVKLFSRCSSNNLTRTHIINRKILKYLNVPSCCSSTRKKFLVKLGDSDEYIDKIVYNEVVWAKPKYRTVSTEIESLCLKYLLEEDNKAQENAVNDNEEQEIVHFPYEPQNKVIDGVEETLSSEKLLPQSVEEFTPSDSEHEPTFEWNSDITKINFRKLEKPSRWVDALITQDDNGSFKFGSYNPHKAVSTVPCGGCGALLQCNDPSIPGFIPVEIFESASKEELQGQTCQRCIFLGELDIALGVNVKTSEYSEIISMIKEKEALVVLMIDLLDFPCSIYPGIFDLIGEKPVIIVGNKVDLLIKEGSWYLDHFKKALISSLKQQKINLKHVKHISLISAKTGYGVEELINVLNRNWEYKCDIYLIGCTNAGKSTLFNTLLESDFCRVKAADLLQRATVSAWPGTTLNLLKFPIRRPTESLMIARLLRLRNQEKENAVLEKIQNMRQNIKLEQIPLEGYVGRETKNTPEVAYMDGNMGITQRKGLNPGDPEFQRAKWFHDTPGVVQKDQIINYLTTAELLLTVPKKMLLPRNFHLRPGYSLFIAGLARLDYIEGGNLVWFTVFASKELPITVTRLEDADHVYEKLLGSPLFVVPKRGKERLAKWPKLSSKKFEIVGQLPKGFLNSDSRRHKHADADVVLSSAGWVTVNVPLAHRCFVEAWTPEGRGIHLRKVPLIKTAATFRGTKIPGTPAFSQVVKEVERHSVTEIPPGFS